MFCGCNEDICDNVNNIQSLEQCKCCCTKTKVKGKFGVAYLIDTPNKKCDPCGWEVEFNDTPSQVDYNCTRMMKWVTCPPLGGCQNNSAKLCCCSEDAEQFLNIQEKNCSCKPRTKQNCFGKQGKYCCSSNTQNQCSCRNDNNRKHSCSKAKPKCTCCKAMEGQRKYFDSIKKCTDCCCKLPKDNNCCTQKQDTMYCCCKSKSPNIQICCPCDSDSDSFDSCCCDKSKNMQNCDCQCKSNTDKKSKKKYIAKSSQKNNTSKESKHMNESIQTQLSKNLNSQKYLREKYKSNDRTVYTITSNIHKKEPDKNPSQNENAQPNIKTESLIKTGDTVLNEIEINNLAYNDETTENTKHSEDNGGNKND